MDAYFQYILISTFCLSFLYFGYLIFQKTETRFQQLRYFLLVSIALSLLIPFSTFRIDLNTTSNQYRFEETHHEAISSTTAKDIVTLSQQTITEPHRTNSWSLRNALINIYLMGLLFFGLRLIVQLLKILYLLISSKKIKQEKIVLLNSKNGCPFTFFNWTFLPSNFFEMEETKDILTHERIHASQYHSVDLVLMELLTVVMWFNPLVWRMKKTVQLVHEYLADEGVLHSGTDKLRYQVLLINQATEDSLISLSSGFTQSLIKERIIMMTKTKINHGSKLKILTLIPLATILFIAVACIKVQNANTNPKALTVIIDAGHGGKDPGARANELVFEKDFTLSIAKMLKEKSTSISNLNLILTRERDEFLSLMKRIENDADLFISIHSNYSENPEMSGVEIFIARDSDYKNESERISKFIASELSQLNEFEVSLKEANFLVLKESTYPALIINIGYMSNPNDLSFITDKSNQELIADKILNAINKL